ncbi:CD44 protein, partial [Psophia crepitans]|nr:CD44 protein [Psophia crepitans]
TEFNVSCRYGGVFHVEKNGRYSLTRSEAVELCRALNSTLATLEQLKKGHELGFETCRYGFVVGSIVIPRINPYPLCAANHTGIYKLSANTTGRYDAYCYNETETRNKTCDPIERLDTSFLNNQDEIVIDNPDGSRYNADGTRHSGESSTSGADDENVGSGSTHDTTPMDTSIRRSSPSYYGSTTPVSQLPDHSSGGGEKEIPGKNSDDEVSPVSTDISLVTAADDSPEKDGGQYPASTRSTSSIDGNQGPHKGQYEPTTSPGETTTIITSQPRQAHIPDWLIVVAALVALVLILAVCIAVNSRRRCGQKKKLVINNGKGAVEDRKTSGLNGDASKSQEMVHLVHKEQSNDRTGACDEFLTVNETQHHQELDMKSGV